MMHIYEFLQAAALSSTVAKERLKDTPCVLVEQGTRFVKAERVVIDLQKELEIDPFLYGIPAEFGMFSKLFKYLGCSSSVKPLHYAMVLDMLRRQCKTNRLDPNEMSRAFKAVKGLFEALQNKPDNPNLFSLYLPAIHLFDHSNDDKPLPVVLRKADSLLFDDAPDFHGRIVNFHQLFLVDLLKANVRCKPPVNCKALVMRIPKALQPKMLTSVVEEKLVDCGDDVECLDVGVARSFHKQLQSHQFQRGVIRLIRHATHKQHEQEDEHLVASVKNLLQSIQVHGMTKVVTQLFYEGVEISGSEIEVPYFLQKISSSGQDVWSVYVNEVADEDKNRHSIALTLSEVIAKACRGLLREMAMYIPEMLRVEPGSIGSLLDRSKIRQDDSSDAGGGDLIPLPGSFIPIAEHHLLDPAFTFFQPGEYVGYELEDVSLVCEIGEATLIYAVIIKEVSNGLSDLFLKSYEIDIGHDKQPRIVPATDLYKFFRLEEIVSNALVPSDQQRNAQEPMEKEPVFKEISKTLREAWRLSEDMRGKVIKRLVLQWHPDRNPGNETFCTDVFQHIMNEIERMEKEGVGTGEREPSGSWDQRESYSNLFGFWGARAKQYTSRRREYRDSYCQHYGSDDRRTHSWEVPPSFCTSNPQPQEAKRWLRQAHADLAAAENDINSGKPSYEWACFKCHQAAEKGLKAAQYSRDASKTNVHNLVQNALVLDDSQLTTLSRDLEFQLGDSTRMRYPDQMEFPRIPNDDYSQENARHALEVATKILDSIGRKFVQGNSQRV